jgi:ABC-type multidrug transport system fused ATPase/permease subunit
VFDAVSYRYRDADVAAVKELSFTIPARSTIAIVGPSGAGKSTVIDLLTKLRQPESGEIRIGGTSLATIDDAVWRGQIAAIHQHGHIFYGTIAENITMFRDDVRMAEIEEAAAHANLLDFVRAAPKGFDTWLGGPDTPLSGGQRQRLQIARAFLIKPALLILDEATSAQDAIAEDELLKTLKNAFAESTIVTVAHRFSAIREAERIVVLQNGEVAEYGDWKTLSQSDGVFRRLFELQSLEATSVYAGAG